MENAATAAVISQVVETEITNAAQSNVEASKATARERFDVLITAFRGGIVVAQDAAYEASKIAMEQFLEHGNLNFMQDLYNALDDTKGFARTNALLYWASKFSHVDIKSGKLFKNNERDVEDNLEEALKHKFWEFAPKENVVAVDFDKAAFIKALNGVITRYSNEERIKSTEIDRKVLTEARAKVAQLH